MGDARVHHNYDARFSNALNIEVYNILEKKVVCTKIELKYKRIRQEAYIL